MALAMPMPWRRSRRRTVVLLERVRDEDPSSLVEELSERRPGDADALAAEDARCANQPVARELSHERDGPRNSGAKFFAADSRKISMTGLEVPVCLK